MSDYNGWTNYETWAVNLWLSNDEPLYRAAWDIARLYADDEPHVLADALKDWIEDLCEATCPGSIEGASFVADLLGAALSEVNFYAIAEHWLNDVRENTTEGVA